MAYPEERLYTYQEVKKLHERIAELENKVVQMEIYDDNLTESRVFRIKFYKLLDPDEAMDIFVSNVKRIFEKQSGNSGLVK